MAYFVTSRHSSLTRQIFLCLGIWLGLATPAFAADKGLVLAIQPILSEAKTRAAFKPLAQYISAVTGRRIRVVTVPNFLTYWSKITSGQKGILYFDAAHFTAYRARKQGFRVLVKVPDTVSYTLVVRDADMVFDASELNGKLVATLGSPSIGAARLNGMFPNPSRQPLIIEISNSQEGITMLLEHKVYAAILPTPLINQAMTNGVGISVVTTTEPIPHIALSASPDIDKALADIIQRSLIAAQQQPRGRAMLKKIGFAKFERTSGRTYVGQDKILKAYWGY